MFKFMLIVHFAILRGGVNIIEVSTITKCKMYIPSVTHRQHCNHSTRNKTGCSVSHSVGVDVVCVAAIVIV